MNKNNESLKLIDSIKLKVMVLLAVLGLSIMPIGTSIQAASLSDLQKQQAQISQSLNTNTKKSTEAQKQIDQVNKEVAEINSDISDVTAKINDTQGKINQTENDIKDKENQISDKQSELVNEIENQNEAIRVMYEGVKKNTFEIMIDSNSLSDIINHSDYLETLENRIESTIDEINKIKSDLENQKKDLENIKNDLNKLHDQQGAYKTGLDQQKGQKDHLLSDTKNMKNDLDAQIAEAKKLSAQVDAQIKAASAGTGGRVVLARDRGTSAVGFQWPMDYKYISAGFGESTPFQSFHSGIDLVNVIGTPIYAAADGTVTVSADMMIDGHYYGYGKYVMIGHNARFSSVYGHMMSSLVSAGDEVKKGDIIGYEGLTGWTTGPHLHFEIRENGSPVNPTNYLP